MMFRVPPAAATEKIPKEAWETQHLSVYAIAGLMTEGVFSFKILLTNYCVYDCAYCVNRVSNDIPRAAFTPQEVANLTINFTDETILKVCS